MEISVTEEVLVTMSAGRDWLSTASDKASDTPVPEAIDVATSTCKCRKKEDTYFYIWPQSELSKILQNSFREWPLFFLNYAQQQCFY